MEFASKNITLKNNTKVKAQIWDTGKSKWPKRGKNVISPSLQRKSPNPSHYRRAIGALVVYDIGKKSSFENCEKWIQDVKEQADPDITIMLVGNKLDQVKTKGRDVTESEATKFADSQKIMFKETSAMEDTNVESAFEELLERIDENRIKQSKKGGPGPVSWVPTGHVMDFEIKLPLNQLKIKTKKKIVQELESF